MSAVENKMSEEQAVNLVRNSLLVAGMEMGGKDGDHWPVIKSTIHSIAKDWEALKTERNVLAEVQKYYEGMIKEIEALRPSSPDALKLEIDHALVQLREIYDATFSAVTKPYISEDRIPHYMKQAKVIMETLESEDE